MTRSPASLEGGKGREESWGTRILPRPVGALAHQHRLTIFLFKTCVGFPHSPLLRIPE